jgi:hypothetical protein
MKIMRVFTALVSSLTYSVVYLCKPESNALEWEAIQNISIAIVVNITSLWMFEQKWFAITKN